MEGHIYGFEKYTTLHRQCHNLINAANKALTPPLPPMLERVKVQHYLAGIQAPGMTAAMAAVRASVTLKSDFDQCADYLTIFVVQNDSQNRNVAAIGKDQNQNNGGNRNNYYRGAGRGGRGGNGRGLFQGGRGGRFNGGRGQGNRDQGGRYKRGSTVIENRYYTVEEYKKLTKEQKQALYDKRKGIKKVRFEDTERATSRLSSSQN